MKRTRFTDEQIIGIMAEHEAGAKCAEPFGRFCDTAGTTKLCPGWPDKEHASVLNLAGRDKLRVVKGDGLTVDRRCENLRRKMAH